MFENATATERYVLNCNGYLISHVNYLNLDVYIQLIDIRSKLEYCAVLIRKTLKYQNFA